MTEPTDSEILDAADDFRSQYMHGGITFDEFDSIGFARAVLAKWGTPPAVAGQLADEQIEDLLECGNPTDDEKRLVRMGWDAARNAPPAQAQAGAVPLTDERLDAAVEAWFGSDNNYDFRERMRAAIDSSHGIKGGQHEI